MNFLFYVLVSIRLDTSVEDEVEVMVAFTDMTPADEETVNLPVVNDYHGAVNLDAAHVLPVLVLVVDNNGGGNPPFIGPHLPPVIDVNINPF
jgi:hypothetical protein